MPAAPDHKADFLARQRAFAAHLRHPEINPAPADVEDRRMAVYRELFYNNIENFLAGTFPVLRATTPDERWHAMVRDFYHRHQSHSPLFLEIPQEFLRYLQDEHNSAEDPPYLCELAHYEWVELALEIDEHELDPADIDSQADLLAGVPILSPLAWPLAYQYPVHRIGPKHLPDAPQPTYLLVYRDRNDKVGFMELNPVSARLLDLLQANDGRSGRELLEQIANELQHPNPETVITGGGEILEDLRRRDVILGGT